MPGKHCEYCGFPLESGVYYCTNCGEQVTVTCPDCKEDWPWDMAFCGKCGAKIYTPGVEGDTTEETVIVDNIPVDMKRRALSSRAWISKPDDFMLRMKAEEAATVDGYEYLLCQQGIGCELRPYQEKTCIKVLRDMWGCSILADEVGLGKTIEAGTVLKEMMVRGLVKRALILVPPTLEDQWTGELTDKFGIIPASTRNKGWENSPVVISSVFRAQHGDRRTFLEKTDFDMLVVDEAQIVKNHQTKTHKFVFGLSKKYALLLSATPIQNDLMELYNLINILKPGHLKTRRNFKKRYVKERFKTDKLDELQVLLSEVMIRNRRADTLVEIPPRHVRVIDCYPSEPEREFYEKMVTYARTIYDKYYYGSVSIGWDGVSVDKLLLLLILLLRELCSSPQATTSTLEKRVLPRLMEKDEVLLTKELIVMGKTIESPSKALSMIEDLEQYRGEKMVIYAEFRKTQDVLKRMLENEGYMVVPFHGELSQREKTLSLELFKQEGDILLSGEVGGQGLNLQFARVMYNYDLPWNPMRIEQRIGRLHRYGQEREVEITSLHTRGTIEEYILHLLTSKIDLFRMVVGEIDTIMSYMKSVSDDKGLEMRIGNIILGTETPGEIEAKLYALGDEIRMAQDAYGRDSRTTAKVFGPMSLGV